MSCCLGNIIVCDDPATQQRRTHHYLIERYSAIFHPDHFNFDVIKGGSHLIKSVSKCASKCLFDWNNVA